jgi:hypothetical protein
MTATETLLVPEVEKERARGWSLERGVSAGDWSSGHLENITAVWLQSLEELRRPPAKWLQCQALPSWSRLALLPTNKNWYKT